MATALATVKYRGVEYTREYEVPGEWCMESVGLGQGVQFNPQHGDIMTPMMRKMGRKFVLGASFIMKVSQA